MRAGKTQVPQGTCQGTADEHSTDHTPVLSRHASLNPDSDTAVSYKIAEWGSNTQYPYRLPAERPVGFFILNYPRQLSPSHSEGRVDPKLLPYA